MDADHALRAVGAVANGFDDDALGADHFFAAGNLLPFARAQDEAHQQHGERGEWKRDGDRGAEADSAGGVRRANQEESAEKHGDDAACGENAMTCKFRFENKHPQRQQDQKNPRDIYRKDLHRVEREDETNATRDAGRDHAGMRELGVEAEDADDEKKEKHVGRDDAREEFLARREFEIGARWIRQRKRDFRAVEAGDFAAVELAQQVVFGRRNDVDHFGVERFLFGEGFGVGDGGGGENRIAVALVGVAAKEGERVVVDFLAHRFVDGHGVAADDHHGRSCASVRAGGHRGDVG